MKIGFDLRPLIFTKAGIATYLYNLIINMARAGKEEIYLFNSSKSPVAWERESDNIKERVIRLPHLSIHFEKFWQDVLLPRAIKGAGIDVFHGPRYFIPKNLSCPAVVTVHDLGFKKFPRFVAKTTAKYFDEMVRSSVKCSRKVITPSYATKMDLVDIYGVDESKIAVIHEGADEIFSPGKGAEAVGRTKSKFAIRRKFILFAGTVEPRKNLVNLLEAYKATKAKDNFDLVIAGGLGWLYDDVLKKAKEPGLKGRVIFTGYVPQEDLVCLYNACEVFVFPSFYEGFGLPVLEAMRCGAAVITSNTSSLKGLFADASYQVDPYKKDSIARGIDDVLSDSGLCNGLKARALAKSKEFSWRSAANQTLELYREVLI